MHFRQEDWQQRASSLYIFEGDKQRQVQVGFCFQFFYREHTEANGLLSFTVRPLIMQSMVLARSGWILEARMQRCRGERQGAQGQLLGEPPVMQTGGQRGVVIALLSIGAGRGRRRGVIIFLFFSFLIGLGGQRGGQPPNGYLSNLLMQVAGYRGQPSYDYISFIIDAWSLP